MTDKNTKPATKELNDDQLDKVQGGAKKLATKSSSKEVNFQYNPENITRSLG